MAKEAVDWTCWSQVLGGPLGWDKAQQENVLSPAQASERNDETGGKGFQSETEFLVPRGVCPWWWRTPCLSNGIPHLPSAQVPQVPASSRGHGVSAAPA